MMSLIGQVLGRYEIIGLLGEGGMATVYKARDTRLDRDVAIKIIRKESFPPDQLYTILARFEREAKVMAKFSHPNIVKVHDYGEHDGSPFLVMEYLNGGTLRDRTGSPMPWREAIKAIVPIAKALQYAHGQNLIHRDIKPSNILITHSGEPMLSDFGIAKIVDGEETQALTSTGTGVGTPEYMAPEQSSSGEVDARADIYSLGVVLYELVTGRKPFIGDTPMSVLIKHARDPLPRPTQFMPSLPGAVEKVLIKALAKNPADRYQNMTEFALVLEELLAVTSSRAKEIIVEKKPGSESDGDDKTKTYLIHEKKTRKSRRKTIEPGKRRKPWIRISTIVFVGIFILSLFGLLINNGIHGKGVFSGLATRTPTEIPNRTIYFLTGHGEHDILLNGDQGYSLAKSSLEEKNYIVRSLDLSVDQSIPDDACTIVIAGPYDPVLTEEMILIEKYVENGGTMIVMEDPTPLNNLGTSPDGMSDYLNNTWGIRLDDNLIIDSTSNQILYAVGEIFGEHVITNSLQGSVSFYPQARSVSILPLADPSSIALVQTGSRAWGETDFNALYQNIVEFLANSDFPGPLTIAVASSNSVTGARVIVFGDSDFASDAFFDQYANGKMFVNSIDWVCR